MANAHSGNKSYACWCNGLCSDIALHYCQKASVIRPRLLCWELT